jgi:hypothetical protein
LLLADRAMWQFSSENGLVTVVFRRQPIQCRRMLSSQQKPLSANDSPVFTAMETKPVETGGGMGWGSTAMPPAPVASDGAAEYYAGAISPEDPQGWYLQGNL